MDLFRTAGVGRRLLTGVILACAGTAALAALAGSAAAQEQFYTQSGGRGLQNAKTNARLTKAETDIGDVKAQVARIQPFAYAQLGSCSEDGEKLRWDGKNWICESETDPTVQPWAKKGLPACSAGSILGVVNGELGCVTVGFVSSEVDPTVQNWAKSPLPNCGIGEVLSVGADKSLSCTKDFQGLMSEKDPFVHEFARTDVTPVLPNCSTSEFLTMMGGRLSCRTYNAGVLEESDPKVQAFARNDISGAALSACTAGQVLTAANQDGHVVLQCQSAGGNLAETLRLVDLSDVSYTAPVSDSVLKFDGSGWTAAIETDPIITKVEACASNEVLTWNGTTVTCRVDVGTSGTISLAGLNDVNLHSIGDGNLLQFNSATGKWVNGALPTCTSGKVLSSDGINFSCVDDAGGSADPIALNELADVRTSSMTALIPNDKDMLRWDSATSKWKSVHDRMSGTATDGKWCHYDAATDNVICDRGAPVQCGASQLLHWNQASAGFECISATTTLGLGTMATQNADDVSITGGVINGTVIGGTNPAAATFTNVNVVNLLASGVVLSPAAQVSSLLVQGNGRVTGNLQVDGNFYVSGSQSIDGVLFANGGIQMPGTLTSTNVSATYLSATLADIRGLRVTNDALVGNDVTVTRDVGVGRHLYVAGAASLGSVGTGALAANHVSVTANADVGGDLRVGGNFYVSGSQSIDGVLFANGGIQMPGTLTSTNVSATYLSATLADIRTLRVTNDALMGNDASVTRDVGVGRNLNVVLDTSLGRDLAVARDTRVGGNLYVGGGLFVSGSQSIDGVLFANGGIQMPGTLTSGNVSATNISGTLADIRDLRITNLGGASGSLLFRDANGLLKAYSNVTVSPTGAIGLGVSGAPAWVNAGLYAPNGWVAASNFSIQSSGGQLAWSGGTESITGAFNPGTHYLAFTTSGTEAMRIASNGMVGIGTSSPNAKLEVAGTISATGVTTSGTVYAGAFVGDGSGLTNVVAASSDRITSGTTNVVVNGTSGYVSFTSAGTTTGYYSPAGVFSAVAISTTTSGKFVDVSTTRNATVGGELAVAGTVGIGGSGVEACGSGSYGKMRYVDVGAGVWRMQFCRP